MIVVGSKAHGSRIMEDINSKFSSEVMEVISREEDGELYGGIVYENYTGPGGSIEAHVSSFHPRWLNRDLLYIIFDYPFKQLDCKLAFIRVKAKNTKSLHWVRSLGFKDYITIEDVFPDDDMVVLRMKRDECRFLNVKPGSVISRRIENGQA